MSKGDVRVHVGQTCQGAQKVLLYSNVRSIISYLMYTYYFYYYFFIIVIIIIIIHNIKDDDIKIISNDNYNKIKIYVYNTCIYIL